MCERGNTPRWNAAHAMCGNMQPKSQALSAAAWHTAAKQSSQLAGRVVKLQPVRELEQRFVALTSTGAADASRHVLASSSSAAQGAANRSRSICDACKSLRMQWQT